MEYLLKKVIINKTILVLFGSVIFLFFTSCITNTNRKKKSNEKKSIILCQAANNIESMRLMKDDFYYFFDDTLFTYQKIKNTVKFKKISKKEKVLLNEMFQGVTSSNFKNEYIEYNSFAPYSYTLSFYQKNSLVYYVDIYANTMPDKLSNSIRLIKSIIDVDEMEDYSDQLRIFDGRSAMEVLEANGYGMGKTQ